MKVICSATQGVRYAQLFSDNAEVLGKRFDGEIAAAGKLFLDKRLIQRKLFSPPNLVAAGT